MKKWLFLPLTTLLLFLIFQSTQLRELSHQSESQVLKRVGYTHEFAICAIFKNEAPWLKEWIVYHHDILGAERFYLYNNDSTDNYAEVLQPFIDRGIVELFDWNSADESHCIRGLYEWNIDHSIYQLGAYKDCINRILGKVKWIAMIDIDEFIVPVKGVRSFYSILRRWEKKQRGSVRVHWRVFGTSNIWDLHSNDLLTEKLQWRNEDNHPWNGLTKGIHRPEAVERCNIHEAILRPGFTGSTPDPNKLLRIHHYWTRTEKKCQEKRKLSKSQNPDFFESFNRVKDETIFQYLPALRKALISNDKRLSNNITVQTSSSNKPSFPENPFD